MPRWSDQDVPTPEGWNGSDADADLIWQAEGRLAMDVFNPPSGEEFLAQIKRSHHPHKI